MADSAIFDLTAETVLTAAHEFVTQDTSAATRAQAATFALMGGLAYSASSVTTANVTATVGTLHGLDLSGLTADRNCVLPDSAKVGERVGVFVTVGDASFELDLVTAATGSLINGANAGGGTSWSRLFITNEVVIFRCINAGGAGDTDWIVEYDGRIPQSAYMRLLTSTTDTPVASSTWTKVLSSSQNFDDLVFDRGDIIDAANDQMTVRRAGKYAVSGSVDINFGTSNAFRVVHRLDLGGVRFSTGVDETKTPGGQSVVAFSTGLADVATVSGGSISQSIWQSTGNAQNILGGTAAAHSKTWFLVQEAL